MASLSNYVVGLCEYMCPEEEIQMREKERLLHALEVLSGTEKNRIPKADRNRMVKSFQRSAAGKSMQDPRNLRPPNVLLKTLNYLLDNVISGTDKPWTVIYEFVMDRLRSIRQDLVIQNASKAHYITILQPIVRFHAYASYRLCEEDISNFDPFINNTHLQECLKRLLCMYDCFDELDEKDGHITQVNEFLFENRPHFEALYLVVNLGNEEAVLRALNLKKLWRTDVVEMSLDLSLAVISNNFVKACKLINQLPKLLLAAAALHLPNIRRKALKVMSIAYNSKNLVVPVHVLKTILLYDTDQQVINDCKYYGLECHENGVCFIKSSFDSDKKVLSPKHQDFIDKKLNDVDLSIFILFGD